MKRNLQKEIGRLKDKVKSLFNKKCDFYTSEVENYAESILAKYYVKHLSTLPDNINRTEKELEKIAAKGGFENTFFIGQNQLHAEYVAELNQEIYRKNPKKYIKTFSELEEKYTLDDWKFFSFINDAYLKNQVDELEEEIKKKSKKIRQLYRTSVESLIVPLVDKSNNEKVLGVVCPTLNTNQYQYHEIVFLSPEIINSIMTTKGFNIFEIGDNEKTPKEYAEILLAKMIEDGMSDLEYFVYNEYFYQIDGEISSVKTTYSTSMPISTAEDITEAFLAMVNMRKSTSNVIKRKIAFRYKHKDYHFRISMMRQSKTKQIGIRRNRSVAIRLLSDISALKSYEDSNLYPEVIELIKAGCRSGGMFLWVGKTGSGKSTSLYRDLYRLWKDDGNSKLITIDNPMEYEIDGATQFDVTDTSETNKPMTIDTIVASILQQNPDYCSLGEIKTDEEYRSFVKLGLRGHTTGGTLHANNTKSAIKLIVDMGGVPKEMVTPNISFVAHQDLYPMVCQKCRGEDASCEECMGKGSKGVIPVVEFAYFRGLKEHDDIYDYEGLIKNNKMLYIGKIEYAKRLLNDKKISFETFKKIELEYGDYIPDDMSDILANFNYEKDPAA
jgi:type II secretory ATPase GspE/PulE/Tfp pilus assembly ATPase PilB-like protein